MAPIAIIAMACWAWTIAKAVGELFVKNRLGALGRRMNANQMINATKIPSDTTVTLAAPKTNRKNVAPMMEITRAAMNPGAGFPACSGFNPRAAIHRRPKRGGENQIPPMIQALTPAATIAIQLKLDTSKDTTSLSPGPGKGLPLYSFALAATQTVIPESSGQAYIGVPNGSPMTTVVLQTTMGDVKLDLFDDVMPITTGNFVKLVKQGFYDGTIFHRVIPGFMIQGGDPKGTGMGGPGYTIKDELPPSNRNSRGTISMANAGPNTGGSQFFINVVDNLRLDRKHPAFGKVVGGMEVVDAISRTPTDAEDRPRKPVAIRKAVLTP
jgi:peptidylprolyl isomerase